MQIHWPTSAFGPVNQRGEVSQVFGQVSSKCPLDFRFVLAALLTLLPGIRRDTRHRTDGFNLLHLASSIYMASQPVSLPASQAVSPPAIRALVYICINIYTWEPAGKPPDVFVAFRFGPLAFGASASIHSNCELPIEWAILPILPISRPADPLRITRSHFDSATWHSIMSS